MLKELLQPKVLAFIKEAEKKPVDYDRLLFNKAKYPNIPMALVVDQLRAKQKAKAKLPSWYATEGIIMPPVLSVEQASSEEAAHYKTSLFTGNLAIDLTGGAGVDAYYLSKRFSRVIYIDANPALAEVAAHNFSKLRVNNIEVVSANSEAYIRTLKEEVDLIYIDPARRDKNKKLFLLEDCSPKILELQEALLAKAKNVLVKVSPMLDISLAIKQLTYVTEVHVVAIKNEVKELLFGLNQLKPEDINVIAIDLARNIPFNTRWDESGRVHISRALSYLYEPNAAILKSGKTDVLASTFDLFKLNTHTHLFTSNKLLEGFPGRKFKVDSEFKYDKRQIKKYLPQMKANIATRNFPDSVEEIRKKTGIKTGGEAYLFGVRDYKNNPRVLLCSKI